MGNGEPGDDEALRRDRTCMVWKEEREGHRIINIYIHTSRERNIYIEEYLSNLFECARSVQTGG